MESSYMGTNSEIAQRLRDSDYESDVERIDLAMQFLSNFVEGGSNYIVTNQKSFDNMVATGIEPRRIAIIGELTPELQQAMIKLSMAGSPHR